MLLRQTQQLLRVPDVGFDDLSATLTVGGCEITARVIGLGPFDIRLQADAPAAVWSSAEVRLKNRIQQVDTTATGVVHWCQAVEDRWEVGFWLNSELPEEVASLYWQDMRRELRYEVNWCAVAQWPGEPPRTIQILNYSLTGMAFTCTDDVPSREEFLIRRAFDSPAASARGTVCWHALPEHACQVLGCRLSAEGGYSLAREFSGAASASVAAKEFTNRGH